MSLEVEKVSAVEYFRALCEFSLIFPIVVSGSLFEILLPKLKKLAVLAVTPVCYILVFFFFGQEYLRHRPVSGQKTNQIGAQ